jgi:hypothetical protein
MVEYDLNNEDSNIKAMTSSYTHNSSNISVLLHQKIMFVSAV